VSLNTFGVAVALALASMAQADVIYSDVTTFTGSGYAAGGATLVSGDDTTKMVLDDITVASGAAGATVNSFTFSVANFNTSAVSARPIIEFFNNNGSGGGPGTLIAGFLFNAISFASGSVQLFTYGGGSFVVPADGTFFAGIFFDDNSGATGASAAQLNLLGQGVFAPPTVGSSQDLFFQTTGPGAAANNPAGVFQFFGGNPTADFGWSFSGTLATPEPGTGLLLLLAGVPLAWSRFRTKGRN
jgi:hypothetical protein